MKSQTNVPERVPRAALISPDPSFRSLITDCLDDSAPSVEWVLRAESDVTELRPESVDRLAERDPDLLFLDVGSSPSAGVRFTAAITGRLPGLTVVAAGAALGVDELLDLLRAGASGYLRRPWSRDEVTEVCSNLLRKMPATQGDAWEPGHTGVSHVIALFAPKGGTGVSTLATNLAVHIRRATGKKTILMDLSPELGTCSVLMGVEPRYSYLDVIESLGRMDERLLYTFLEEHESGAWVMASPAGVSMCHQLAPESVGAVLHLMRRHFEYVVVDVGRGMMDEAAATALDLADERLVVTTAELPTLRNVRRVLPHVSRSGDPARAIRLVVNRYEDGVSVPTKDVERAVGLPLFQIVNEDRERVGRSVNLGRPLVMNGSSPFTKAVGTLGDRLAADDLLANGKKSPLGGLLRTLLPPFGRVSRSAEPANAQADARDREAHERPRRTNGRHGGHADASGHAPSGNGHRAPTNGRPDRTAPPAGPKRPMHKEGVR